MGVIYMLGGADPRDFGDALILRCWLDHYRDTRPGEAVHLAGPSAKALDARFGASHPQVMMSDAIAAIANRTDISAFWPAFRRGISFFTRGGFDAQPPAIAAAGRAMLEAETLHLHGGGYLRAGSGRNGFLLGLAVAVQRRTGARLVATGQGLAGLPAPEPAERAAIADALAQFVLVEARDGTSFAQLRALLPDGGPLAEGTDDSFLHPVAFAPPPGGRSLHLAWPGAGLATAAYRRVVAYLQAHGAEYDRVSFWPCAAGDEAAAQALATVVPGLEVLGPDRLLSGPLPVAPGDHVLAGHPALHLIAARGGAVGGYARASETADGAGLGQTGPGQTSPGKTGHGKTADTRADTTSDAGADTGANMGADMGAETGAGAFDLGSGFFRIGDAPITAQAFAAVVNRLAAGEADLVADKRARMARAFGASPPR